MTRAAVLVIDVQAGLVPGAHRESEVLGAIRETIARVRKNAGVVVFVQHCHSSYRPLMKGSPGWEIHPSLEPRSEDIFVEKTASDAFFDTPLDSLLQAAGITRLFIVGLQTEYCVDATCRSALSRRYAVTLVSDAHTTGDSHLPAETVIAHHNAILANLAHPDGSIDVLPSMSIQGAA